MQRLSGLRKLSLKSERSEQAETGVASTREPPPSARGLRHDESHNFSAQVLLMLKELKASSARIEGMLEAQTDRIDALETARSIRKRSAQFSVAGLVAAHLPTAARLPAVAAEKRSQSLTPDASGAVRASEQPGRVWGADQMAGMASQLTSSLLVNGVRSFEAERIGEPESEPAVQPDEGSFTSQASWGCTDPSSIEDSFSSRASKECSSMVPSFKTDQSVISEAFTRGSISPVLNSIDIVSHVPYGFIEAGKARGLRHSGYNRNILSAAATGVRKAVVVEATPKPKDPRFTESEWKERQTNEERQTNGNLRFTGFERESSRRCQLSVKRSLSFNFPAEMREQILRAVVRRWEPNPQVSGSRQQIC